MIRKLVTLFGHECVAATSGGQAFERTRELKPDVGLFDIGLPDVSGCMGTVLFVTTTV